MQEDRYITIGAIRTRYWAAGNQGAAIILLHGMSGYIEQWLPCFDLLASRHRVYAIDLPGHGRTDKSQTFSYSIADFAQFVRDFMAALKIERAYVVGHSLGGAIATRLALLYPDIVQKLVLISSAGLGQECALLLRIASLPLLGEKLTRPNRAGAAESAKFFVHDPSIMTAALLDRDYEMITQPGAHQAFLKTLRANGNLFGQSKSMYGPNVAGLSSIAQPVLVVWGMQDQIVPVAHAETAAKRLPNNRVQIFENCGHDPVLEHTQAFNQVLFEFIA